MKCTYCTKDHDSDYICDEMFGGFAQFTANQIAQANATRREAELTTDLAAARSEVERLTQALVDIKNYALDHQQWAIANTAEFVQSLINTGHRLTS